MSTEREKRHTSAIDTGNKIEPIGRYTSRGIEEVAYGPRGMIHPRPGSNPASCRKSKCEVISPRNMDLRVDECGLRERHRRELTINVNEVTH